jgi:transposase-like protein
MSHPGRKPLTLAHVHKLDGSERAKQRMTVLLKTLEGQCTVSQACQELGISESHFHALRDQWMQGSLALLEPRPLGRPPRAAPADETSTLRERVAQLEHELALAQLRRDVAEIVGHGTEPKKGAARS